MAQPEASNQIVEQDELLMQPGTYFNPQTEVLVVIDDSTSLDQEVFNMEDYEGADWVRISDDVAIADEQRDALLEEFQTHYHPGFAGSVSETALEQGDEEVDEDRRDRLLEAFQTHYHPGSTGSVSETALEQGDDELDADEDGQDPGRED